MRDIRYVGSTLIAGLLNVLGHFNLNVVRLRSRIGRRGVEPRPHRSTSTHRGLNIDDIRDGVKRIAAEVFRDVAAMVAPFGARHYERSSDGNSPSEADGPREWATASYDVREDIPAEEKRNLVWTEDTILLSEVTKDTCSSESSGICEKDAPGYDSGPLSTYYKRMDGIDLKEIAEEARSLLVDIKRSHSMMVPVLFRGPEQTILR